MFAIVTDYDKLYNTIVNAVYTSNRIFTLEDILKKVAKNHISKQDILVVADNLKNIGILEEGLSAYKRIK